MQENATVYRMFIDAQQNPALASALGRSMGRIDDIISTANSFGYDFTKSEYLDHLQAVVRREKQDLRRDEPVATTLAVGEEGKKPLPPQRTTKAIGEEDRKPRPIRRGGITQAIGEDDKKPLPPEREPGVTSMALGEEDRKPSPPKRRPDATSMALGEEGKKPRPPVENPDRRMTTLAVGEEGKKPRR